MKFSRTLLLTLPIVIAACGGGSSSSTSESVIPETADENLQPPVDSMTAQPEDGNGTDSDNQETIVSEVAENEVDAVATPIEGLELINGASVEQFDSGLDVQARITRFSIGTLSPETEVILTNNRPISIRNVACDIDAISDNTIVDSAFFLFSSGRPIDPGESVIDRSSLRELDNFDDIDRFDINCDWADGSNNLDVSSGPILITFLGYTRIQTPDRPALTLLMTNDSGTAITNAACGVEAKVGNTIIDDARVFFTLERDLGPGEGIEDTGAWLELRSLDDFDSEPFNPDNLNCRWEVVQ